MLSIVSCIGIVVSPIVFMNLIRKKEKLQIESHINTVGALYKGMKTNSLWKTAFYIIFMARRLVYALIYTLMIDYPSL